MEGQSDSSFENSIESGIGMDGWMDAVADGWIHGRRDTMGASKLGVTEEREGGPLRRTAQPHCFAPLRDDVACS